MSNPTRTTTTNDRPRRRADAERSIAAILEAAVDALASDPEASMAEIARQAGVVRATIYMHFPTREALIRAVTERAIAEVTDVIRGAEPQTGEPAEALERVLTAAWQGLGRFHALVTVNAGLPAPELRRLHTPVIELLAPLIKRGQRAGAFRKGVPVSWHLSMILALIHAASGELAAGRLRASEVEPTLRATVLGAVAS
jgi:TetR/AcrR family transcriptional regulator, mexCD-oprJ operon repressor